MPRAHRFVPAFAFLATLLATSIAAPAARAAGFTVVPAETTVTVGDTFTLRVTCDAVPDLKGFQVALHFPAARLQFVAMPAGELLTDPPGDWFATLLPDVTAPADTAWLDAARLDGSVAGPGVLAYLTLKALTTGDAALTCVWAEMRDSNNVPLAPGCAAALVHVVGPVPTVRRSWGALKPQRR